MPRTKNKRNPRKEQAYWTREDFTPTPENVDDLPNQGFFLAGGLIIFSILFAWMVTHGGHL